MTESGICEQKLVSVLVICEEIADEEWSKVDRKPGCGNGKSVPHGFLRTLIQ